MARCRDVEMHGLDEKTLAQLKVDDDFIYHHVIGNFWSIVLQAFVATKVIKP